MFPVYFSFTGVLLILLPAAQSLTMALSNGHQAPPGFGIPEIIAATRNTPSALWIAVLIGVVLIGYVVGHLFYRLDPKTPDRSGFTLLARNPENTGDKERRENLGCRTAQECEFPYPDYDHYLERRGLTHLIPFVLWRTHNAKRSKTYINLLKIRLRHYFPNKYGALIRNEAHVRLASSAWYVSRVLIFTSIASLATIGGCIGRLVYARHAGTSGAVFAAVFAQHIPLVIPPLLVFAFGLFADRSIRRFFHYQRLREVFFVLETAYTAFRDQFDFYPRRLTPKASGTLLSLYKVPNKALHRVAAPRRARAGRESRRGRHR